MKNTVIVDNNYISNTESQNYMWSLETVSKLMNTVEIDRHFQSPARWKTNQMREYLNNLFHGLAPSKFLFADVDACLTNTKSSKFKLDIEYYSGWAKKNVKYLNVDGNNRLTTIKAFFSNQLTLSPGRYYIRRVNGSTPGEAVNNDYNEVVIGADKTWDELDEDVKRFILSREICVELFTKSTRAQLSDLFLAVNSGTPLNQAEKRNAIISDISRVCREMGVKYYNNEETASNVLLKAFKKSEIKYNRREVDAWFTHCAFIRQNGMTQRWNSVLFDDAYQSGSTMDLDHQKFELSVTEFFDKWVEPNASLFGNRPSVNALLDLYILKATDYSHIKTIKDVNEFVETYCTLVDTLCDDRKTLHKIGERSFTYKSMLRGHDYLKTRKRYKVLLSKLEKKIASKSATVIESHEYNGTPGRKLAKV